MQCIFESDNDDNKGDDDDDDENKGDGTRLERSNERRANTKAKRVYRNVIGQNKCNTLELAHPCNRRLRPQYEQQSKLSKTNNISLFSRQLTKINTMLELLWPLVIVNLRIWV